MPLTETIPDDALPILEEIRKEVPRPTKKARLIRSRDKSILMIRWPNSSFKGIAKDLHNNRVYECCPAGMLPLAPGPSPYGIGYLDYFSFRSFTGWFDEQDDIEAVVDAIWPKQTPQQERKET